MISRRNMIPNVAILIFCVLTVLGCSTNKISTTTVTTPTTETDIVYSRIGDAELKQLVGNRRERHFLAHFDAPPRLVGAAPVFEDVEPVGVAEAVAGRCDGPQDLDVPVVTLTRRDAVGLESEWEGIAGILSLHFT